MALLEVSNLGIAFGGLQAVAQLDLSIEKGHLYGLIGPNGAGKTTALRVALGLLAADAGQVRLLGRDPRSAAGSRPRRVGSLIEGRGT